MPRLENCWGCAVQVATAHANWEAEKEAVDERNEHKLAAAKAQHAQLLIEVSAARNH